MYMTNIINDKPFVGLQPFDSNLRHFYQNSETFEVSHSDWMHF